MFLDPAKLLVILIVALVVLGPDKLPTVARQLGAAWGELRRFRERLETEVRGTFPDLPSSQQMVQAVRSPLAFLDQLADAHEREQKEDGEGEHNGSEPSGAIQPSKPPEVAAPESEHVPEPEPESEPRPEVDGGQPSALGARPGRAPRPAARQVGRTRPWQGSRSAEPGMIPDDPSMN